MGEGRAAPKKNRELSLSSFAKQVEFYLRHTKHINTNAKSKQFKQNVCTQEKVVINKYGL